MRCALRPGPAGSVPHSPRCHAGTPRELAAGSVPVRLHRGRAGCPTVTWAGPPTGAGAGVPGGTLCVTDAVLFRWEHRLRGGADSGTVG